MVCFLDMTPLAGVSEVAREPTTRDGREDLEDGLENHVGKPGAGPAFT